MYPTTVVLQWPTIPKPPGHHPGNQRSESSKQVGQKACATPAGAADQKTRGWAKAKVVTAGVEDVGVLPNAWLSN